MKKTITRILGVVLAILTVLPLSLRADATGDADRAVVLFTHDLHSHLLPTREVDGSEYGGYARLMYAIDQQRQQYPDAILVDGGDFSMGSLFQTVYTTDALELRIMGAMGYDAVTFGNHEFDYMSDGVASMLNAATASGDALPALVAANFVPPEKGEEDYNPRLSKAFESYGVRDYTIIHRGGVYFAVFGILGDDANLCAPDAGMNYLDPIEIAQKTADAARRECLDKYGEEPIVICLSHSGTKKREGEDYELAKNTEGIDLIVSAHTHTTLTEPIEVNGTYIVSANEYGKYLGAAELERGADGAVTLVSYKLIKIDESIPEDETVADRVADYKRIVEDKYLSDFGYSFHDVLVRNRYIFETVKELKGGLHESPVCNIYSDAYKWAAENALGKRPDVALTAAGVIRGSLPTGDITVYDVFNAASLGVGNEGELVAFYLTGADLKRVLEIDASLQPKIRSAQLYISGVQYSINRQRVEFNKVDRAVLLNDDGTTAEIEDDKLYLTVTGMYACRMIGIISDASGGVLSIVPRDENGNEIPSGKLSDHIVTDQSGRGLREWVAIAGYLESMGGEMDERYAREDGRKIVYKSILPWNLLRNANKFTYIFLAIIIVAVLASAAVVFAIVKLVARIIKKKKQRTVSDH